MGYVLENWGSFVGVLGFLASIGGLVYAFLARRAAKSAEQAAREARQALTSAISSIDVERAVAIIARLMELHRQGNWEFALSLHQDLRRTLSEIEVGIPSDLAEHQNSIREIIPQITAIINLVNRHIDSGGGAPVDISSLNETLNGAQEGLELLQATMLHRDEHRGG